MTIGIWFFCPGTPSIETRLKYESAMPLVDGAIRWVAPPGRSAVFTREAKRLSIKGNGSVMRGLEKEFPIYNVDKRVAVAFSAGYAACREIVSTIIDRAMLDGLCLLDALHTGFDPDNTAKDSQLVGFSEYAKAASEKACFFYSGHTDVKTPQPPVPGAFASTTQAHVELIKLAGGLGGNFQVRTYDAFDSQHDKQEHAAALTSWGPGLLMEMLCKIAEIDPVASRDSVITTVLIDKPSSFAEAIVAAAVDDLERGTSEDIGPNDGYRIREYAARFNLKPPLNWCALAVSTWIYEAAMAMGVQAPVKGSPGAQALGAQFKAKGLWVNHHEARENPEKISSGDIAVWRRPPHSWTGHTGVVESTDRFKFTTIEGNQNNKVSRMSRDMRDDSLLGFGVPRLGFEPR